MRLSPRIFLPLLALLAVPLLLSATRSLSAQAPAASDVAGAHYRLDAASAKRSGAPLLSGAARRATFRFDPAVAPADRQAFLAAVAAGRPEARRLIALVDGLVDVRIGPTGMAGAIGLTEGGEPGYRVTIDLDLVIHRYGPRGVQRTVLHELGHVIDHALVTDDVSPRSTRASPPDGAARTASSAPAPTVRSASPRPSPSGRSGTSASTSTSATRSRRRPPRSTSGASRSLASRRADHSATAMSDTFGRTCVRLP